MLLTYRYRIKDRTAKKTLRRHAASVNQVWNYCCDQQRNTERLYWQGAPKRRWASAFDLHNLTSGTSKDIGIHSGTINAVCDYFVLARDRIKGAPRFRHSFGPRRSLGWVPFKATGIRGIDGNSACFMGKRYRLWLGSRPIPADIRGGCFVEDARGRWYICFQVEVAAISQIGSGEIGIDLGLKSFATVSDGEAIENPRHFRRYEQALGIAQRAGNKGRAKAIQAKIANARKDFLHKLSTRLVRENRLIVVGNVNSDQLKRTRMAKSVSDAGWSMFRTQLRYKASRHGAAFVEADERWTSQTCSACGCIPASSPKGVGALGIRTWDCSECGAHHDRDVNSARNILRVGRSVPPPEEVSRQLAA